ncbi:MAG TPA: hypothetical protein PK976_05035, partial [Bacteroidales bacterium]|nr:hypothetical protein [Bacteroidales bacterium]
MKKNSKSKNALLWIISFIIMTAASVYQRLTGPTHPVQAKIEIEGTSYLFKLIRSHGSKADARIVLSIPDTSIHGIIAYKKINATETWENDSLVRLG